ncbi:MAG TPA: ion channel [Pirellulales bacterium]|jgi:voltage-gated potassium channel Kch|nr:ion channel [Pirellulales bacterium]
MKIVVSLLSVVLILALLVDAFETTILPRRVTHRFRFVRMFYVTTWKVWRGIGLQFPPGRMRESFLSIFGPLSLLTLLATWVIGLIFGFALLHWSLGTAVHAPESEPSFLTYLYWSGNTFFTLGYGDVTPVAGLGRVLAVIQAGMGFGFLALIIGYLPVIYQAFSRREAMIALLDARAGSPPSAAQMLLRVGRAGNIPAIMPFLAEWERWSAELLESHLSFPMLSFYRSQHDNQSWLSSLTAVLDTCAVFIALVKDHNPFQAQLTFAISRHAAVDLSLVLQSPPAEHQDRLPPEQLHQLREMLQAAGFLLHEGPVADAKLAELRGTYEPFVNGLSKRLLFTLPHFVSERSSADNWQRSAWMKRAPEINALGATPSTGDTHF